ncbi:hypothetical protein DL764_008434 [Monosporascus ibericus]|uniref:FAM192A/Fyv6 N-terminal domain-containing protein n=1 Tax=Monosporascus ibericus TaxID=155417 RepID=A0A4Q4SXH9_9PEZI|nr:hypothetical protein DL764_008434 [Monosporascus ibericus]
MSSRFVSGGTIAGDSSAPPPPTTTTTSTTPSPTTHHTTANPTAPRLDRLAPAPSAGAVTTSSSAAPATSTRSNSAEWEAAQAALAAERKQREEARRRAVEGEGEKGSSLYDILQANKAAKQAAFEEANRLRNQFRALDDDEVDFLDEVRERKREEEECARREVEERLEVFRRAQRAGERGGTEEEGNDGGAEIRGEVGMGVEEWSMAGRKRKRDREKEAKGLVKGVKRRASEGAEEKDSGKGKESSPAKEGSKKLNTEGSQAETNRKTEVGDGKTASKGPSVKPKLGLVDYGSDDDDDD